MAAASTPAAPTLSLLGTGWGLDVQLPAFARGGIATVCVYGRSSDKAAAVLGRSKVVSTADECIGSAPVCLISMPPHTHKALLEQAAKDERVRVVVCEKPTALNAAEARAMHEAAKKMGEGRMALIDHELRMLGPFRVMRQLVQAGVLGRIRHMEGVVHRPERLIAGGGGTGTIKGGYNWWSDASKGGGVLGAVGSHVYDLFRFVSGGSATHVKASLSRAHDYRVVLESELAASSESPSDAPGMEKVTSDDRADVVTEFQVRVASDTWYPCTGVISVSVMSPARTMFRVDVVGENASLVYEHGVLTLFSHSSECLPPRKAEDGMLIHRTRFFGGNEDEDDDTPGMRTKARNSMPRNEFSAGTVQFARAIKSYLTGKRVGSQEVELELSIAAGCPPENVSSLSEFREAVVAAMAGEKGIPLLDISAFHPADLTGSGASTKDGVAVQTFLDACRESSASHSRIAVRE
jgi:predicted dehydrogenase